MDTGSCNAGPGAACHCPAERDIAEASWSAVVAILRYRFQVRELQTIDDKVAIQINLSFHVQRAISIVVLLFAVVITVMVFRRFRLPPILGYLLVG